MKWCLLVALLASGCTAPAVVSSPPPVPLAVGGAGVSVSGQVGMGWGSSLRGSATVVARPLANVGVFASGLLARRDSTDDAVDWVRYDYGEAGALGAMPLRDGLWLTGSVAIGRGEAESGASALGPCSEFGCTSVPYLVTADVARVSGRLGLYAENSDGTTFGAGVRLARASYSDVQRDRALDSPAADDFTLWIAEPYASARYAVGAASLDLHVTTSRLLKPSPLALSDRGSGRLYAVESSSVNVGVTLGLWRLLGGG